MGRSPLVLLLLVVTVLVRVVAVVWNALADPRLVERIGGVMLFGVYRVG